LQENIAKLYINNRDLNKAVHDDILILKNQQAIALQSQISPHFIYNTLDAINWKAADLLGRKNPISKCVIDMANVIEYSMDSSTFLAPLREEIEISKKYIDILNQRYNEKLNVKWIVDDTLLDCKVIKICIQPLIENAVFHGISNDIENGKIYIKVHSLNDNLIIEIADNGNGVTEENLNELKEKMDDYKNSPKKHTALRNVNIRIKLLYGENYGLNVKNSPEGGFLCSVSMPIDKIKENYIEE
jgi:two-component system sensor histidine kinase YesM